MKNVIHPKKTRMSTSICSEAQNYGWTSRKKNITLKQCHTKLTLNLIKLMVEIFKIAAFYLE